jgi:hypothetical protein
MTIRGERSVINPRRHNARQALYGGLRSLERPQVDACAYALYKPKAD